MTERERDETFDLQLHGFLAWQATDTAGAPTATDVAARISSRVGAPSTDLRLVPPRLVWVVLAGLLIVALVGLGLAGAGLVRPHLSSTSTPAPSPIRTPAASATPHGPLVATGSASTAIGQLRWTSLRGDQTNVPGGQVFEVPGGFAALEQAPDGQSSRVWQSPDGMAWTVTPMPVPASGPVSHWATSAGHWLWSQTDFRLWHSSDFNNWTEVSLDGILPPAIEGVTWVGWLHTITSLGTTTVVPWSVGGRLALEQLLGFQLEPGEQWELSWSSGPLPLGTARDVFRTRRPQTSGRSGFDPNRIRVGSIRVGIDGSFVTITDADRNVILARIDSSLLGVPASTLAADVNAEGELPRVEAGAVISDAVVRPFDPPAGYAELLTGHYYHDELFAAQDRFVAFGADQQGSTGSVVAWTSANGLDWRREGSPDFPLAAGEALSPGEQFLLRPGGPEGRLAASVRIADSGGAERRGELWSSADGLRWVNDGVLWRYDGTGTEELAPFFAPSGGYFATGSDGRLHVSPNGTDWTAVDSFDRVPTEPSGQYWGSLVGETREATFIGDQGSNGDRVLWLLRIDAVSP
jgi:hypothetical protein